MGGGGEQEELLTELNEEKQRVLALERTLAQHKERREQQAAVVKRTLALLEGMRDELASLQVLSPKLYLVLGRVAK